jgi:hypothetical protein
MQPIFNLAMVTPGMDFFLGLKDKKTPGAEPPVGPLLPIADMQQYSPGTVVSRHSKIGCQA